MRGNQRGKRSSWCDAWNCIVVRMRVACAGLFWLLLAHSAAGDEPAFKVGVFENRPIVFEQAPGRYAGLSIDFLESVASRESLRFEYVHGTWKSLLSRLEEGDIDLLVGIAFTPERAERFDYTSQTLINNWGVVYRNASASITSLADLQGKRVALMTASIHSRVFKRLMAEFNFVFEAVQVPTYTDALAAAAAGDADAAVINRVISLLNSDDQNVIETGIIFNPVEVRFAAPKGRHASLLATIDRQLAAQKQDVTSPYHQSMTRWFGAAGRSGLPLWVVYAALGVGLLLLGLAVTTLVIRRQVSVRTRELSESELRFRQLAENINEVFWIGSPDWKTVHYVSPAFERVWGYKPAELYAQPMLWADSVHPDDREQVRRDIERKVSGDLSDPAFRQYRVVSTTGETRWILARAYPITDGRGQVIKIAGIAEDITSRKEADEKIAFMALHDPLTSMFNRFAFEQELALLVADVPAASVQHALLYIDLDQFKIVNDTCGHAAGDELLVRLSALLRSEVDSHGIIARLGGDEFGVILRDSTMDEASAMAQRILAAIEGFRFIWKEKRFAVGASIGLVMLNGHQLTQAELLSAADMACYAAKERGRNRVHVYEHDDAELLRRHGEMQWVSRIALALEDNRFLLHRQRIDSLAPDAGGVAGHEYLLRLLDERGDLIYPDAFIPAAERFALMPRLDRWVVGEVFRHLRAEAAGQPGKNAGQLAFINLSGQVFTDESFADFVINEAQRCQVDMESICFEITETVAISNLGVASRFIDTLSRRGFKFALDDFGSGMSSFSYLKSLQVDFVKIDGVFIRDLFKDPMHAAIVDAMTRIAHTARLRVIAEWVESAEITEWLQQAGVDFAQGYAIERPCALPAGLRQAAVNAN
ncbi:MAG: EAL domain-containing protein [Gammaproteobacteria bacterium]|nr:EAL domain-containing protein [Gammaproteobacteria bacterium]